MQETYPTDLCAGLLYINSMVGMISKAYVLYLNSSLLTCITYRLSILTYIYLHLCVAGKIEIVWGSFYSCEKGYARTMCCGVVHVVHPSLHAPVCLLKPYGGEHY